MKRNIGKAGASMRHIAEHGQGFMEYSILIVIIAVLVMGVLILMGPGTIDMYAYITASF
jgi:hypothetical protein